jgi:hypothetical protein
VSNPKEHELQQFVVQLLRFHHVPKLIYFSVPNEGQRAPRTAAFLKSTGMMPGVADLVVVIPGGRVFFMELKTLKGRTSAEQRAFRFLCEANGTPYELVRTPEEAASTLHAWGALTENPLAKRRAA